MAKAATESLTLEGRKIVLGVTGGIAAYKAAALARELTRRGAEVRVVMTRAATHFVAPLTFAALTQNPVCTTLWEAGESWSMEHITNARWGDLLLVAPATANIVGKFAHGIADDALSTLYLAWRGPVLLAPAMNTAMYEHPAYRANEAILRGRGVEFVDPEAGSLACGEVGAGRLADPERIAMVVESRLATPRLLEGRRVVLTVGPTREFLDPMRFLSNPSSGKMGFAMAEEAARMGGSVTVIAGPVSLPTPPGVERVDVVSAQEMCEELLARGDEADLLIFSAAVADFRPGTTSSSKIKKSGAPGSIPLRRNPDVAATFGQRKRPDQVCVGFAADTDNPVETARKKLKQKNFDLVFANPINPGSTVFGADHNRGWLIGRTGRPRKFDSMSKQEIAGRIVRQAAELLRQKRGG